MIYLHGCSVPGFKVAREDTQCLGESLIADPRGAIYEVGRVAGLGAEEGARILALDYTGQQTFGIF